MLIQLSTIEFNMRAQLNRSRQSATEFAKLAVAGGRIANIANNDNKTKMKTTQNVTQPKSTTEDQWAAADKDVAATNVIASALQAPSAVFFDSFAFLTTLFS